MKFRAPWLTLFTVFLWFGTISNPTFAQTTPHAGDWTGEPSVSFLVKADGQITNFKISVPLAMGSCDLSFARMPVTKMGEIVLAGPNGQFFIKGQFKSRTTVEGKITIKICPDPEDRNNVVMLVPWVKDWSAKVK